MVSKTYQPQKTKPRSVYIHVPFCRHRCGYCNFALVANRDYLIERYLDAIETEISWLDEKFELETLFLGGGTPSHLNRKQLCRLGRIIRSRFDFSKDVEFTAECNPNDITPEQATALAELGVNRVSLGVQSLDLEKLKRLERSHSPEEVQEAVRLSRTFAKSVSIDMIFSAPKETCEQWIADLGKAIDLQPDHISTYELTYEKGTRFWNQRASGALSEAEEELRAEMYSETIEILSRQGWLQYEVSSFSKPDHRCTHNCIYWSGAPYFAFGPGASRFVDGIRETNHQSTMRYLKLIEGGDCPVADREQLSQLESAKERMAIGLRVLEGVDATNFEEVTGVSMETILGGLEDELLKDELLIVENQRIRLSAKGVMLADWIAAKIVDD